MTGAELEVYRTLTELEATIERGLATFVLVGQALLEIRRRRLYREAGYGDFDAYCRERWGWKRARADQMIRAAETVALLDTTVSSPPANEAQARELARIEDPERVTEVWQEVTERYGERVTAEKVRAVVEEFAPETVARYPALDGLDLPKSKPPVIADRLDAMEEELRETVLESLAEGDAVTVEELVGPAPERKTRRPPASPGAEWVKILRGMTVTLKSINKHGGPMRFSDGWPADERMAFIARARELRRILERWEDEFPAGEDEEEDL